GNAVRRDVSAGQRGIDPGRAARQREVRIHLLVYLRAAAVRGDGSERRVLLRELVVVVARTLHAVVDGEELVHLERLEVGYEVAALARVIFQQRIPPPIQ